MPAEIDILLAFELAKGCHIMKYHDTGTRDPLEALSTWLQEVLNDEVSEFRVQTGYFSAKALGLILPILERAAQSNLLTYCLLGSNNASTQNIHVTKLFELLDMPRTNAHLGIVSFGTGLFHPKVYHIRRNDGSQAAYVGSANLTREGLALNIEAAISLDTRHGDNESEISRIAAAIDGWFTVPHRPGFTFVDPLKVIEQLTVKGILSEKPLPKQTGSGIGPSTISPKLARLTTLPAVSMPAIVNADSADDFDQSPVPVLAPVSAPTVAPVLGATITPLLPPTPASTLQTFSNKNAFWIETGALTGGSSNQLDLSMVTKHGNIFGSISLFGVNGSAIGVSTPVTIRYQGQDYVNNMIKFPVTAKGKSNGTWRLQLNGTDPSGKKLTSFCSNFVQKILLFTPISPNHYEISLVRPRPELSIFQASSLVWDCNRGGGRHFGRI